MKEITCIQQYVIDNLINNKRLSIENLIEAVTKTCSTEQFNNILTVLIKTQTSCTNKDKVNFVKMNMYISKEVGNETKIQIIKILREQFNTISLSLKEAKDYIDSCIGEYNIFPKVVTQEKINELIRKLEPYNVSINTIKLMQ
jgi:ribosomal protein L7/L12